MPSAPGDEGWTLPPARVPVPAMGRRDVVVAAQRGAHAGRNRFLTDREVCESGDFAGEEMPFDALFKDANADHHL